MLSVPTPPLNGIGAPSGVASAKNWTLPVGVPPAGGIAETTALKVTVEPLGEGLADDERELVELAFVIVNVPALKLRKL